MRDLFAAAAVAVGSDRSVALFHPARPQLPIRQKSIESLSSEHSTGVEKWQKDLAAAAASIFSLL